MLYKNWYLLYGRTTSSHTHKTGPWYLLGDLSGSKFFEEHPRPSCVPFPTRGVHVAIFTHFAKRQMATLPHLFFHCVYSQLFWKQFESYYYSLTKEFVHLTLQDILIGIITSKCPLLNYLSLIAKIYLWNCRRSKMLPNITGLRLKVKKKYETEKYIYVLKTLP